MKLVLRNNNTGMSWKDLAFGEEKNENIFSLTKNVLKGKHFKRKKKKKRQSFMMKNMV